MTSNVMEHTAESVAIAPSGWERATHTKYFLSSLADQYYEQRPSLLTMY